MILDNAPFLIAFGIIHGALVTWFSWFLADNIFSKFQKYIETKDRKYTFFAKTFISISWIVSFEIFYILFIYLSTLLPIKENVWLYFARPALIAMFLTTCLLARYNKQN